MISVCLDVDGSNTSNMDNNIKPRAKNKTHITVTMHDNDPREQHTF